MPARRSRKAGQLFASARRGDNKGLPEPVLFAQEVLDRAWRSKRRIAAQGKGMPLGQRVLTAFGARTAVFVDDRDFMEATLDSVLRVRGGSTTSTRS